jgi:hypothetical protein
VFFAPLSPTPSIFSAAQSPDQQHPGPSASLVETKETPVNTEGDAATSEPADGDFQVEYSSAYLYSPSIGAVTKHYLQELRSTYVLFDNVEYFKTWHLSGPVSAIVKEFHFNNLSSNYGLVALTCCIYRLWGWNFIPLIYIVKYNYQ